MPHKAPVKTKTGRIASRPDSLLRLNRLDRQRLHFKSHESLGLSHKKRFWASTLHRKAWNRGHDSMGERDVGGNAFCQVYLFVPNTTTANHGTTDTQCTDLPALQLHRTLELAAARRARNRRRMLCESLGLISI